MESNKRKIQGLAPLMSIMFINSFIDLGHKITLQNTIFKVYDGATQVILTAIINGLILLPFIAFYRSAGFLSDKYPKAQLVRYGSVFAFLISVCILASYLLGWFWFSYCLTFILAIQSAYISPAKYGLIKEMVPNSRLNSANALSQGLVTIGILMGTFVFTLLFEKLYLSASASPSTPHNILPLLYPLGILLIVSSSIELLFAWKIPVVNHSSSCKTVEDNHSLAVITQDKMLWAITVGLCAFWSIGQMLIATYPSFAEDVLLIENTIIIQGMMLTMGVGIMVGAFMTIALGGKQIGLALIPPSGIAISSSLFLLPLVTWIPGVFMLFFAIGFFGGIFIVPLNTAFQFCTREDQIGKNLAGLNLIKNIAMVFCLLATIGVSVVAFDARHILGSIAVIGMLGIGYLLVSMPQSFVAFKGRLISLKARINIEGIDQLEGDKPIWFHTRALTPNLLTILQSCYPRKIVLCTEQTTDTQAQSAFLMDVSAQETLQLEAQYTQSIMIQSTLQEGGNTITLKSTEN